MSKFRVIAFTRQLHSLKVSIWLQVLTTSIWMQVSGGKFWLLICEYIVTVLTQPDTCCQAA